MSTTQPAHTSHLTSQFRLERPQWTASNGEIVNPHSGMCLDDPASNTTNGTQLILYTSNGGNNQKWTVP